MRVTDVLHSCSHRQVAEAAIVSIGGGFARRVQSSAAARGQSIGEFTSDHVRQFRNRASERDWRAIASRMHGADLALLVGLEAVMDRVLDAEGSTSAD